MKYLNLLLIVILTVSSVWAKKPLEELGIAADVTSPVQLEDAFNAVHELFLPPLPGDAVYIHSEKQIYFVDWNSGEWPKELLSQAVGELKTLGGLMYPEYTFYVLLDYSNDLVIYNEEGAIVFRRTVEYDPYFWALNYFGLSDAAELTLSQQELYHAAKFGAEIQVVPVSFAESYLKEKAVIAKQEAMAKQELLASPMMMARALPPMITKLLVGIEDVPSGVEVQVGWPGGFESATLDLFCASDLVVADWQLVTNFPSTLSSFEWVDVETNQNQRFYVAGSDYDEDADGISSARERFLYKTREDLYSTDADGLGDGWELQHGLDPLSSTGTDGALGDADNDGYSNLEEQREGTDPLDPNDNFTTGTVATIRYYYDEDDRMTDFYCGAEVAQKPILTVSHNIAEEVSAK